MMFMCLLVIQGSASFSAQESLNSTMEPEALPHLFEFEAMKAHEFDFSTALVCVMQHVPQQEQIGSHSCHALVCKAWCDAAAAARTTFDLERCSHTLAAKVRTSGH